MDNLSRNFMYKLLLFLVVAVYLPATVSAQSITLEAGAAAVPSLLPSWTLGASVQIPIVERFSLGASYYRWADNADRQAFVAQYPIRDTRSAEYIFPQLSLQNRYWGNNTLAVFALYKPFETERFSLEVGAGWSSLEYVLLAAGIGVPDAGNQYQQDKLGFKDYPETPAPQRLCGVLQTRYKLSDNFALQGKIAAYGTEHFTATVGISFMPWGDKPLFDRLFAGDKQ
jgi:hypothetical protein